MSRREMSWSPDYDFLSATVVIDCCLDPRLDIESLVIIGWKKVGTQDPYKHAGPKVQEASEIGKANSDYAEELARLQRQEHEAKDTAEKYGFGFSKDTEEHLRQADMVPAGSIDPAASISAGSIDPAASISAGPAEPFPTIIEPRIMLIETTRPPCHTLAESEHSTRFPSPSDLANSISSSSEMEDIYHHPSTGIFSSSSYDADFGGTVTNLAPILVPLPDGKIAIGTKWILKNKEMSQRNSIKIKAILVAQGLPYEKLTKKFMLLNLRDLKILISLSMFTNCESACKVINKHQGPQENLKIRAIGELTFFLMDCKLSRSPRLDLYQPRQNNVSLYRSKIVTLMYLTASSPDIKFCSLWYLRDSPFVLEAYSDSDYAGSHGDRKSTTSGCQFLCRKVESCKLTFHKNKFSPQWRFLVHTIQHCLSSKSGSWDQFGSSLAIALISICLLHEVNLKGDHMPLLAAMLPPAQAAIADEGAPVKSDPDLTTSTNVEDETLKKKKSIMWILLSNWLRIVAATMLFDVFSMCLIFLLVHLFLLMEEDKACEESAKRLFEEEHAELERHRQRCREKNDNYTQFFADLQSQNIRRTLKRAGEDLEHDVSKNPKPIDIPISFIRVLSDDDSDDDDDPVILWSAFATWEVVANSLKDLLKHYGLWSSTIKTIHIAGAVLCLCGDLHVLFESHEGDKGTLVGRSTTKAYKEFGDYFHSMFMYWKTISCNVV
ncbi:hypothetical protein Tco_0511079 [Tanacetum coccineum]